MTTPQPDSLNTVMTRYLDHFFTKCAPEGETDLHNRIIQEVERILITQTLKHTAGNQLQAAKLLGINRNTLRKKVQTLGI